MPNPADEKAPRPRGFPLRKREVVTLAIFARWGRFASERDFYRYATGHATGHLTDAFPDLPSRPQLNRLTRSYTSSIERVALYLAELTQNSHHP